MVTRTVLAMLALGATLTLAPPQTARAQEATLPGNWSYAPLYDGVRAGTLIGTEVDGMLGEELGQVVDLVVSPDNRLQSLVIEASGMLDAGQARFAVPWTQLMDGSTEGTLTFPGTASEVLGIIRGGPRTMVTPGDWRVVALLGQPVRAAGDDGFGTASDLVFDPDGRLRAVVVEETAGVPGGPYAVPWESASVEPGLSAIALPARADQIRALGAFDSERTNESAFSRH